mgnify:CR=1 FL=1
MSGILMMIIAIVVLGGAYLLYGRYLQNKWGIDQMPKLRHMRWKTGLTMYRPIRTSYSVTSLHQSQVQVRSTDRSSSNLRMASGTFVDLNRRSILWSRSGFRIYVCICKE